MITKVNNRVAFALFMQNPDRNFLLTFVYIPAGNPARTSSGPAALQSDRDPAHQHAIHRRHEPTVALAHMPWAVRHGSKARRLSFPRPEPSKRRGRPRA